jgi:hypothetical protein
MKTKILWRKYSNYLLHKSEIAAFLQQFPLQPLRFERKWLVVCKNTCHITQLTMLTQKRIGLFRLFFVA